MGIKKGNLRKKNIPVGVIFYLIVLTIVVVMFSILDDTFLTFRNIDSIFRHLSVIAISALGYTFILSVRRMDMSFYMTACFGSMTMAFCISLGFHPILSVLVGLISGGMFGFFAGYIITKFKTPDIITTIAIGFVAFGSAYLYSGGAYIFQNFMSSGVMQLNEARILGISVPTVIMLSLFIVSYIFLEKTTFGRMFYATGSNIKAAFYSGIKVKHVIIAAFIICAVLATLSATITNASAGRGAVRTGLPLLLPSISASFLGFAIMRRPSVLGTFMATLLTSVIANGMILLNIPFYFGDMMNSILLIIALSITYLSTERIAKSNLGKTERMSLNAEK